MLKVTGIGLTPVTLLKGGIVLFAQVPAQMNGTRPADGERVDITSISIDARGPAASRREEYLGRIKNPYAFKCGEVAVNIQFSPEGKSLKEALVSYLAAIKKSN